MQAGAITEYIDVAQVAWWAFFLAFIAIVLLLRREDQREGYPKDNLGEPALTGPPILPDPRTYIRHDGTTTIAPHRDPDPPMRARKLFHFGGSPLAPIGDRLTANVGPGTYAMRADTPFVTNDGKPQVQPLRVATEWSVMRGESDPRGMRVLDVRFNAVGTVRDIWVDRGVKILRYVEIELDAGEAVDNGGPGPLLIPIYFCDVNETRREIRVMALRQGQFATIPRPKSPDQITAREEDQVSGYCAGGEFHLGSYGDDPPTRERV